MAFGARRQRKRSCCLLSSPYAIHSCVKTYVRKPSCQLIHSVLIHSKEFACCRMNQPRHLRSAALPVVYALSRAAGFINCRLNPLLERASRGYTLLGWLATGGLNRRAAAAVLGLLLASMLSVLALITSFSLDRATRRRVRELVRSNGIESVAKSAPVHLADLQALPEPVLRYFQYSLRDGQRPVRFCSLKQKGAFRLRASPGMKATEGWKKVHATQYFSATQPGYVWAAAISLAPCMWIRGWDSYVLGKGHMLWKLFSALTLVNFGGREIDQSALVRYLSEAVWFPTALLPSRTLRWEALDSDSARATLVHGGLCVSAVFHFNARGQIVRLTTTDRPRRLDDGTVAEDSWTGYYRDYQERKGMQLPMEAEYVWNLVGGAFSYAVLRVHDIRWSEHAVSQLAL